MSSDFRAGFLVGIVLMVLVIVLIGLWPARAETWLVMGFTKHAENKRYCETNPGVFQVWRPHLNVTLSVGLHQKSDCEAGGVGVAAWQPMRLGDLRAGAMILALTSYDNHPLLITPAPAFSYEVQKNQGVDVTGWPGILWHIRWRFAF